jgi:hypothetical protein
MKLPSGFWEQLPGKSAEELYDMLLHEADYLPEALVATRDELARRNLPPPRAAQLQQAAQSNLAIEQDKASVPLDWPLRILIFVVCSGLLGMILAVYYDNKGYKRKARDCWVTLGVSALVHLGLSGCVYVLRTI